MGREIKRVPLDFNWPINVVWGGFLNPFYKQCTDCPTCSGSGSTPEYKELENKWYGHVPFKPEDRGSIPWKPSDNAIYVLAERNINNAPEYYGSGASAIQREANRLCDLFNGQWVHHLNDDDVAALVSNERLSNFTSTPTARQVNEWSLSGLAHDAINCWVVCKAEAKRLGIEIDCKSCKAEGSIWPTAEIKAQCESWTSTEPPKGDGYQLWETVSEGSPISPVFATPEELAEWLVSSDDYKWKRNDAGTTKDQWLRFINGPGWAPSFVSNGSGVMSGVGACGKL